MVLLSVGECVGPGSLMRSDMHQNAAGNVCICVETWLEVLCGPISEILDGSGSGSNVSFITAVVRNISDARKLWRGNIGLM